MTTPQTPKEIAREIAIQCLTEVWGHAYSEPDYEDDWEKVAQAAREYLEVERNEK